MKINKHTHEEKKTKHQGLRIIYSNNSPCWTLIVLQGHFLTLYHPHSYFGKKQTELQSDIDAYADVIANVNADTMKSTKELKVAMLSALANWGGIVTSVGQSYYGSDYTAQTILDDSFDWAKLCTGDRWIVNYRSWGSSSSTRTSVSNFTEICSLYYERYQYLRTYEEKQLSTLQTEIEHKKLTKSELSSWSLKKLIDVEGDEAVFSVNVQANKLLVFMLRKGYIDEKYVSYVNYFNHYCFGICTTN